MLRCATGFANSHLQYFLGSVPLGTMEPRKALFFGYVYDRKMACIWGGIALLLSVVCGVVAGVVTSNLGLGLARGAALLVGLSTIQGLIIWFVS